MLPKFNLKRLVPSLEKLSARARSAFAAACAERQAPVYARVSELAGRGDPDMLANALESLWGNLEGRKIGTETLQRHVSICENWAELNQDIEGWTYAEDAVASTAYAIESRLTGAVDRAAWAAKRATELLDMHIIITLRLKLVDARQEGRITADPLMQAELRRQQNDLAELAHVHDEDAHGSAVIANVHARACIDALRFFDRDAALKA